MESKIYSMCNDEKPINNFSKNIQSVKSAIAKES